jgi:Flp pilus assembly pilin Flp
MRRGPRRLEGESGQTLVEYALIIAVVSLGAIVALGFLSGKVNELFSKAGNSLNTVSTAAPGSDPGGGGPGPGPSLPTVPTMVSAGVWFSPGGDVSGGPNNYQGMDGVYSDSGGPVGAPCSFTVAGASWTGVWINRDTGPGNNDWEINGDGSGGGYDWACLNVAAPAIPAGGSISSLQAFDSSGDIPGNPDGSPNDDDWLFAVTTGWSASPTDYDFLWEWNATSCGAATGWNFAANNNSGDNDDAYNTPGFSGTRHYRVTVTANNGNGSSASSPTACITLT